MDQCMLRPGQKEIGSYALIFIRTFEMMCDEHHFRYELKDVPYFNIEFGRKDDIFTRLYPTEIIQTGKNRKYRKKEENKFISDTRLKNEFLAKVGKGAFLHKYAGLWTLGLDIQPSSAQRSLHLFVYLGCVCGIEVLFTHPTTPVQLVPEMIKYKEEYLLSSEKGRIFDSSCSERKTNNITFSLGKINENETKIKFTIMTSSKKLEMIFPPKIFGQIQLLNENNDIVLAIRMHENVFAFGPRSTPGSWKERVHKVFQIFTGGNIVVEIHLNKYYVSTNITSRHIKNLLINKFWPAEWWNGGFMKNISNAQLRIYGDFVLVTPVFINVVKEEDVFEDRYAQTTKITSFKRGKPVEFKITIFGVLDSHTEINTLVNDINLFERVLYARLPVWMINRITMGGDIYLYDYTKQEGRPEPNTYKKLLKELKSYGTILCFTAKVMKKEEMFEEVGFEVHLNHDPYNKDCN
uniref:Galectin n=1 Tax=Meloidogyne hapla TaxID=6305 RepID=A0A1I8BC01_MELHA